MSGGVIFRALRHLGRALGAALRRVFSPFAWRDVRATQAWVYQENALTGDRRAVHLGGGYAALDIGWLRGAQGRGTVFGSFSRVDVTPRGSE
ncbi:hypothetical protein [Roseovarius ramblicola]|uniref:Uncharacterized protein n=1 Tax=Roseovarius ramblicola TaxID=2022336 RepID=A0ABV5HYP3_9RHOB